ncbi:helix-turn-helix domain-containing protein [Nocardia caishijiensis]|uniref:AraC family transcriptional regulator n=1 Tax=Nocardia caishijiensis TaxID=184756 RepID=A0ABQ6YGA0_9NOCA|nr:helix-turn-helix domain-containing protein [Nocardia caishijiensis]KAF0844825.1 AraC family transcriptional regulator [Nocardia caishijiensis]
MVLPALPETCAPDSATAPARLWLRLGHAVYIGPGMALGPHSTAVASLGVGLDGPFRVRAAGIPDITARSFLFRARVTHHILDTDGRRLFCFFDPTSSRVARCLGGMSRIVDGFSADQRNEAVLIDLGNSPDPDIDRVLDLASVPVPTVGDRRIAAVAAAIRDDPTQQQRAADKARAAGLSTSYFLRIFADQTGTSFRRYVQWARMLRVAKAFTAGHDLTRAATDAGFASPSHFSDTFRAMFGLTPTAFAALGAQLRIDD